MPEQFKWEVTDGMIEALKSMGLYSYFVTLWLMGTVVAKHQLHVNEAQQEAIELISTVAVQSERK